MIDSILFEEIDLIDKNLVADIDDEDIYWGPPLTDEDIAAIKNLIGGSSDA